MAVIAASQRCVHCGVRWRQGRTGLCRTCENEERECLLDALRRAETHGSRLYAAVASTTEVARPIRTVVINGEAFDVVWDGSY